MSEIFESFCARVKERTGKQITELPVGRPSDLIGSHILMRWRSYRIVARMNRSGVPTGYMLVAQK